MNKERYVLNLIENGNFSSRDNTNISYWTGKQLRADDIRFPGVSDDNHDKDVKVYSSKKRAENAVKN